MIPTLQNDQGIFLHLIDQAVLQVDAAGPTTSKMMLQWLWVANPLKGLPLYGLDQFIDAL